MSFCAYNTLEDVLAQLQLEKRNREQEKALGQRTLGLIPPNSDQFTAVYLQDDGGQWKELKPGMPLFSYGLKRYGLAVHASGLAYTQPRLPQAGTASALV
jgi:hypothetical protein